MAVTMTCTRDVVTYTSVLVCMVLYLAHGVSADSQMSIGEGDAQTCLQGEFDCGNLYAADVDSPAIEGNSSVNGTAQTQYDAYTTNEIISLLPSILTNDGTADANGRLVLTVEKNISGTFGAVGVIINDTVPNRSIVAEGTLDIATLWNESGWNTTLAGVGQYRVRVQFITDEVTFEAFAPFVIVDNLITVQITQAETYQATSSANITFNASGYRTIQYCDAYLDETLNHSATVSQGLLSTTTFSNLPTRKNAIRISCNDGAGHEAHDDRNITIIKTTTFGGTTTNLAAVNLSNITNLILEKPALGKIQFTQSIDLSGGGDIDQYVTITPKVITVDSVALAELNRSATLTFYGIDDIVHPVILLDGRVCATCDIDMFSAGTLQTTVAHFSSYSVGTNSQLNVSDTTDSASTYPLQNVQITANYTNTTSGAPIVGANCNVTFNDTGTQTLSYDGGSQTYTYTRMFSASGVFFYTTICSANGYETLNTTEYASINAQSGPIAPQNITVEQTSRGNENTDPISADGQGGNTTEIDLEMRQITGTWQGVYGNLSGQTTLSTADKQVFYNWSFKNFSGEIYASRAQDVNFITVECGQDAHIAQEDAFIGSTGEGDAVNNTFTQHNHPAFNTGPINLTDDSCPSTNVFTASGQDTTRYYQVLMVDGANNTIYTSILEHDGPGFDGNANDFQMLVPTRQDVVETYYYWFELT